MDRMLVIDGANTWRAFATELAQRLVMLDELDAYPSAAGGVIYIGADFARDRIDLDLTGKTVEQIVACAPRLNPVTAHHRHGVTHVEGARPLGRRGARRARGRARAAHRRPS